VQPKASWVSLIYPIDIDTTAKDSKSPSEQIFREIVPWKRESHGGKDLSKSEF